VAAQGVAFPEVKRLRRVAYWGGQVLQGDQPSIEESSTTKSLKNASPDEHSDDGCKSFAGIVELEAALLEILELVRTVAPTDSTILRFNVNKEREARVALETAFQQIEVLKDQVYKENLALRDEVDRVSMFEEIVGPSQALQTVLSRVIKVAPTDSGVLITGETGTGKELIARAVHNRSRPSQPAFVTVNC